MGSGTAVRYSFNRVCGKLQLYMTDGAWPHGVADSALVDGGEAEFVVVVTLLFFHHELAKLALQGVELGGGRVAQPCRSTRMSRLTVPGR